MRDFIVIPFFLFALVAGQLLWKLGVNQVGEMTLGGHAILAYLGQLFTNAYFWLGCMAYAVAVMSWLYLLSRFDFSYIYPFTAFIYVASLLGARMVLAETIPMQRWMAVGLICIGIIWLSRS